MGKILNAPNTQVETIISKGVAEETEEQLTKKFSVTRTKFKRFQTYLEGKKRIVNNMERKEVTKQELQLLIDEIINAHNVLFKPNELKIEKIGFTRDGHSYDIHKGFDNDYKVFLYDSDTPVIIDKEKINYLLGIIKTLDVNQHYGARYFFNKIIPYYELDLNADEFSGGRNRAKYYFPLYLFPMKIIERELGLVKVKVGRGGGICREK